MNEEIEELFPKNSSFDDNHTVNTNEIIPEQIEVIAVNEYGQVDSLSLDYNEYRSELSDFYKMTTIENSIISIYIVNDDICNHKLFSRKTNVNFVKIIDKSTIEVKTYERGVGWTLACGTGCCASVVAASKLGLTKKNVKVILELGYLNIEIDKKDNVFMTGPAVTVFTCDYKED